jgi:hypothetical protein
MLNNPDWDQPSLTGFKEWLMKQPQDKIFCYDDNTICAVAKYLSSIDMDWRSSNGKADQLNRYAYKAFMRSTNEGRPVTFGDVLAQIGDDVVLAT